MKKSIYFVFASMLLLVGSISCGSSDDNINEAIIGSWAEESSVSSSEYVYEFKSDGSGNYMVKSGKGTDVIPIHYVITEASNGNYTYLLQIIYDRKNGIEEGHQSWMNIDSDRMFLYDVLPDSESSGIIYEFPLTPIVLKRQGI